MELRRKQEGTLIIIFLFLFISSLPSLLLPWNKRDKRQGGKKKKKKEGKKKRQRERNEQVPRIHYTALEDM